MQGRLDGGAYPDSVRRVQPPKMMIPKTLAALPNSQYATTFEVLGGKLEALAALS